MNQQVRFCRSFDGTRIAYAATGEGPPLVKAPHGLTHLERWLSNPEAAIPGQKMGFSVSEAADRADIIEYLRTAR